MNEQDVYLISNEYGEDKCPEGKLALYTNVQFNIGEVGNILIISPNIQLNEEQLASYGFIIGENSNIPLSLIIWTRMPRLSLVYM